MSPDPLRRAIYLTGPTAVGKTAVGMELARRISAEVVALNSMTPSRGLDVGTAKPALAEWGGVPHHLIDALGRRRRPPQARGRGRAVR
jgi:tRNA dimethylallyltransferase